MFTLRTQFFILFLSMVTLVASGDDSLDTTCTPTLTKMYSCMDYSTGKTTVPSSDCCTSVEDVRKSSAVCLCYIIQQTHDGSLAAKSVGIQFDRLFALPSECKMANTTISNCPKLLNLSPTSPDYKIFSTNTSTANSTVTPTASNGMKHGGSMLQYFSAIAIAIAIHSFSPPLSPFRSVPKSLKKNYQKSSACRRCRCLCVGFCRLDGGFKARTDSLPSDSYVHAAEVPIDSVRRYCRVASEKDSFGIQLIRTADQSSADTVGLQLKYTPLASN